MRIKISMISAVSLGMMLCGLYLAFMDNGTFLGKRTFFTLVGILGLFIGGKLIELEERLAQIEGRKAPGSDSEIAASATHDQ